ncbi:MAG: hypothetical protein AB1705_24310 [Verrucomicrobiota bacterium]
MFQDLRLCRRIVFGAVAGWAMLFALFTNHTWEDYFITYRASKNLATGHGLVFTPGEKLHTFTSPIGVLLPALLNVATGDSSDALVLWLFRLAGAAALGGAAALLLTVARRAGLNGWAQWLLVGMFGLDPKIVGFSINGMETPFVLLFLALTIEAWTGPRERCVVKLGLAWAGLMWTRPDSFLYIGALAAGWWLFGVTGPAAGNRRDMLPLFLKAGLVTTGVYLPWMLWAHWYYGSAIPHTVVAKALGKPPLALLEFLQGVALFPLRALTIGNTTVDNTFQPAYVWYEGWHYSVMTWARWLAMPCALYWLLPFARPHGRAASFTFFTGHLFLTDIARLSYPWYLPVLELLGLWVLADLCQQGFSLARGFLAANAARQRQVLAVLRVAIVAALAAQVLLALSVAWQLRHQQRLVEEGVRKELGLWLAQHAASPRDTVFLESLGYIGFYSQLKMYDFPGLASREVVAARARLRSDNWTRLIRELKPDWVVLRGYEVANLAGADPGLLTREYREVKRFDATPQIEAIRWLPGRGYLLIDATFVVFRRL